MVDMLWWSRTPGPILLRESLINALVGKGTAWLVGDAPWSETLRRLCRETIEERDPEKSVVFYSAEELRDVNAAELVFRCNGYARASYRPAVGIERQVQKEKLLRHTLIWIYDIRDQNDSKWLKLSMELAKLETEFKLVCEGNFAPGNNKNVLIIDTQNYFSGFDSLHFAMSQIQQKSWTSERKMYVCRLCNELSDQNVELLSSLIKAAERILTEPIETVKTVLGENASVKSRDAFYRAQLLSLYPLIEEKRGELIEQLKERIMMLLPTQDEYGASYIYPEDLELRHLVYLEGEGKLCLSDSEHQQLHFLYNSRNQLSHRRILDTKSVLMLV